ncbi:MAG: hypothetical protein QXK74_07215 [Candidatus Nitrosocaldaceae archaeon]
MGFHDEVYLKNISQVYFFLAQGKYDDAYAVLEAYATYLGITTKSIKGESLTHKKDELYNLLKIVHAKLREIMVSYSSNIVEHDSASNTTKTKTKSNIDDFDVF